jgi:hypothetical protein
MNKFLVSLMLLSSPLAFASTAQLCSDISDKTKDDPRVIRLCSEMAAQTFAPQYTISDKRKIYLMAKFEECRANSGNCSNYKMKVTTQHADGTENVEWLTLDLAKAEEDGNARTAKLNELTGMYSSKCANAAGETNGVACKNEFENPQRKLDLLENVATFFAADMFPGQSAHIDVADLIKEGKPFGGKDAVLITFRDSLLGSDNGDIADLIRDPIHVPESLVQDVGKQAADILNNICGDLCKGLNVKF